MSSYIRILNRLNQPDSEDTDIENLKSEMETLVDKAEQIEANLENIEHIDQQVQIVVNDYDEEDNENSLDDEVQMITSDIGEGRGKGKIYLAFFWNYAALQGVCKKEHSAKHRAKFIYLTHSFQDSTIQHNAQPVGKTFSRC